jgi:hypothetical protein
MKSLTLALLFIVSLPLHAEDVVSSTPVLSADDSVQAAPVESSSGEGSASVSVPESSSSSDGAVAVTSSSDGSASESSSPGNAVSDEQHAKHDQFLSMKNEIWAKLREALKTRREAMKAARALPEDQRQAARQAAKDAFKATLAELRAQRKAAMESQRSNQGKKDAVASVDDAQKKLDENAQNNEDANAANLASAEEPKAEEPVAETQEVVKQDRAPASAAGQAHREMKSASATRQ